MNSGLFPSLYHNDNYIPNACAKSLAVRPWATTEVLEDLGYYQKWNAQVMADILLPQIAEYNPPENNETLRKHTGNRGGKYSRRSLFLIKEALRNLGLTSTEKIFTEEAGMVGQENIYKDTMKSFLPLKLSDAFHMEPPLLSQLTYLLMLERPARRVQRQASNKSVQIRDGRPQALPANMLRDCERMRHDQTDEQANLSELFCKDGRTPDDSYWQRVKLFHEGKPLDEVKDFTHAMG